MTDKIKIGENEYANNFGTGEIDLSRADDPTAYVVRDGDGTTVDTVDIAIALNELASLREEVERLRNESSDWQETAKTYAANTEYYRGLLVDIGMTIGREAYISDDGVVHNEPLVAKVPELVVEMKDQLSNIKGDMLVRSDDLIGMVHEVVEYVRGLKGLNGKLVELYRNNKSFYDHQLRIAYGERITKEEVDKYNETSMRGINLLADPDIQAAMKSQEEKE